MNELQRVQIGMAARDPKAQAIISGVVGEPITVCPVCKGVNVYSLKAAACGNCGLPDEVVDMGGRMVARWAKRHGRGKGRGASLSRRPYKAGRKGVR